MKENILDVVNKMIEKKDLITDVDQFEGEIYFCFNKKHFWSLTSRSEFDNKLHSILYYYPKYSGSVGELIGAWQNDPQEIDVVPYKAIEMEDGSEAVFLQLKKVLLNKHWGLDDAFNEILNLK